MTQICNSTVSANEKLRHEIVTFFVYDLTNLAEFKVLVRAIMSSEVPSTLLSLLVIGRINFLAIV